MTGLLVDATGRVLDAGEKFAGILHQVTATLDAADPKIQQIIEVIGTIEQGVPGNLDGFGQEIVRHRDDIVEFVARLSTESEDLAALLERYLRRVDSLADPIAWSWSSTPAKSGVIGPVALSLGAEVDASASISAGPTYRFEAGIDVDGRAATSSAWGSAALGASLAGRGSLAAGFTHPDDTRVIDAAASDLSTLVALARPDALLADAHFVQADIRVEGSFRFDADLKASYDVVGTHAGTGIGATAKITIAGNTVRKRTSRRAMVIRRSAGNKLTVTVDDLDLRERRSALSLDVTIGIDGLEAAARPFMDRLSKVPVEIEELLEPLTQKPSKIVTSLIDKHVDQADLRDALTALVDQDAATSLTASLIDKLRSRLVDEADLYITLLKGNADRIADTVIESAPLDEDARNVIRSHLGERIEAISADIGDTIRAQVDALADHEAVNRVEKSLTNVTDEIDAALVSAETQLERIVVMGRRFAADLTERHAKIANAIATIENSELSLALGHEVANRDEDAVLLAVTFQAPAIGFSEDAQAAYRALLKGDASGVLRAATTDAEITVENSLIKRARERRATTTLSINAFGIELGWRKETTAAFNAKAVNGVLDLLEGTASSMEAVTALGETVSFRANLFTNLLRPDAKATILARSVDKNPSNNETHQYLNELEASTLIAPGATARFLADSRLASVFSTDLELTIETALQLSRPSIDRIMARTGSLGDDAIYRCVIRNHVAALSRSEPMADAFERLRDVVRTTNNTRPSAAAVVLHFRGRSLTKIRRTIGGQSLSPLQRRQVQAISRSNRNAAAFIEFLDEWQALRGATSPYDPNDRALIDRLAEHNQDVVESLDTWIDVRGLIAKLFADRMSPWNIALLRTLRDVADRADENTTTSYLVPIASWSDEGQRFQVAIV